MGSSDAFGGSLDWSDTRRATQEWLQNGPAGAGGDGRSTQEQEASGEQPQEVQDTDSSVGQDPGAHDEPVLEPAISKILARVVAHLNRPSGPSGSGTVGGVGGPSRQGGSSGGGGTGSRNRAASTGSAAVSATYGLRTGNATLVEAAGLSLTELEGLTRFEQADRIVNAVSRSASLIDDAEMREVNARFVWKCLEQEDLTIEEAIRAWVTEFVFRSWLTRNGLLLRDGTRDGATTVALEKELRLTLESAVNGIPVDANVLESRGFQDMIRSLLGTLERIFVGAAA